VVNLRDGLAKEKPLAEAAWQAAGLVAYCNAEVGAKLPEGMPDWPALRARNGSKQPFGVKYFQIGNESWFYDPKDVEWKLNVISAYVEAMRAVDPKIQIIADAHPEGFPQRCRDRLGDKLNFMALHSYLPFGALNEVRRNDRPVDWEKTTAEEAWLGLISTMPIDPATGLARFPLDFGTEKDDHGYDVAVTEWNWNGWGTLPDSLGLSVDWIRAFGAANYLHAMMREPKIQMATQSMLIGTSWGINAIRVDPSGKTPSFIQPVGAVTGFYASHHGRQRLKLETTKLPTYRQPLTVGSSAQGITVTAVDLVATGEDRRTWVHIINRQFDTPAILNIKTTGFEEEFRSPAKLHVMQEDGVSALLVTAGVGGFDVSVPPRSIACLEMEK
jgi:alpha-N-arabinofuranosidase